jgi:hypothetical protein
MNGQGSDETSSQSRETAETCETAGLAYRRLGWSVIPLKPKQKVPKLHQREDSGGEA